MIWRSVMIEFTPHGVLLGFLGLDFSFYTLYHYCHGIQNVISIAIMTQVPFVHLVVASPQHVSLVMFHGNCHHSTPDLGFPDVT